MVLNRDMYYHQSPLMADPVFWSFDGTTLSYELLKKVGRCELRREDHREWDAFRDRVRRVTIRNGITGIGPGFFRGCKSLEEIHLPGTLKTIGCQAFMGCEALKQIHLPPDCELDIGAFQDCRNLTDVRLGQNLACIPASAFEGCSGLREIAIPESVKEIQAYAFHGCGALQVLQLPEKAEYIHPQAFDALPDQYRLEGVRSVRSRETLYYACIDPCDIFYLPGEIRRLARCSLSKARAEILLIHDDVESVQPQAFSGMVGRVLYLGTGMHVLPEGMLHDVEYLQTLYVAGRLERVEKNSIPEGIRIVTLRENGKIFKKIKVEGIVLAVQDISELRKLFYNQLEDDLKRIHRAPACPLNPCDLL